MINKNTETNDFLFQPQQLTAYGIIGRRGPNAQKNVMVEEE